MKRLYLIILILFCFIFNSIKGSILTNKKKIKNKSKKWSVYQGSMNWYDAKAKCASIYMRLPTRDEFVEVYKHGKTKTWENIEYPWYWTMDEFSEPYAYGFAVVDSTGDVSNYGSKRLVEHVRCIR